MVSLPDTHDVEMQLLRFLASVDQPRTAQQAYSELANHFDLGHSVRIQRMPNQGEPHWPNRVRTAMNQLVQKGYAERAIRDRWSATQKGKEWLNLIDDVEI